MIARPLRYCILAALLVSAVVSAPARADVLVTVAGDEIKGVVLHEGTGGVWFEVAPDVAMYFQYDRVVRAEKWDAARNAKLFKRTGRGRPLKPPDIDGPIVLETDAGVWVAVKPRLARFIDHRTYAELEERALDEPLPPADSAPARDPDAPDAKLWELYDHPEPLSPAQVVRRVGQPARRRLVDGHREWLYDLQSGETLIVRFQDGRVRDVDVVDERAAEEPPEPEPAG